MSEGLARIDGVTRVHPTEGNEVFVAMPETMVDAITAVGCKFQRDWRLHPRHHRFVTSWATADEDVDRLLEVCRAAAG
jgi:threonine aldolase